MNAPSPGRDARIAAGIVVLLVLGAAVAGAFLLRGGGPTTTVVGAASPQAGGARGTSGPPPVTGGVRASATCTSAPSRASDGTPTTFDPGNAVDGRPDTAWRCDGDGAGRQIVLRLPEKVRVSELTIVPGYAKIDPGDGSDRYAQNRRITSMTVDTGTGAATPVSLDSSPTRRDPQTVRFRAAETSTVTLTILTSDPGRAVGTQPASDRVAISEITFPELR
ncbi:MAG: hypothetical protein J0I34_27910 [Pseudonocardia sp.]|uniref:NADase-type glycan-binding domain-containing protein n=1 Tax=unclassified Pseudonocardia TaxID=2619320 RepID=UPI00086FA3D3|nr:MULTISPECIES: hypothetical protein [unclassified Pseudonocardia]MBN9112602.1 hypothetical protein [Pseudonocardia sp.]ODU24881.1 MAG: hypothetical protein ABS80_11165 [Pseudonocardia sp. SCN 72-51]ODV04721.1 MAG: hypothetical protein ABT15_19915 [Pseudonocardia sp. SCN 73-27]